MTEDNLIEIPSVNNFIHTRKNLVHITMTVNTNGPEGKKKKVPGGAVII